MVEMTPKQIFEEMPSRFLPEKAKGVNAVIQFDITGDDGGQWYLTVGDGAAATAEGVAENPKTTVTMAASDFTDLITGTANSMQLFMTGKIKLQGDLLIANAMLNWFQK
ncbi:MAG: SCP2 sterol-binding domain-containing protein [Anaerolineae bacterium]|nr:SCP2 sterol-binding domain-containing protein [Anaerolineae bacterium]